MLDQCGPVSAHSLVTHRGRPLSHKAPCAVGKCPGGGQDTAIWEKCSSWGISESQSYLTSGFSFCSGWLAALSTVKNGPLAVTIIMMVVAGFFTLCAGLSLFLLQRVSRAEPTANRSKMPMSPGQAHI